jgi:hypothetical protein
MLKVYSTNTNKKNNTLFSINEDYVSVQELVVEDTIHICIHINPSECPLPVYYSFTDSKLGAGAGVKCMCT